MAIALVQDVLRAGLAMSLVVAGGLAGAAGLQVTPTSLALTAARTADGVSLGNTGEAVIHAQVRVYRWTQDASGDQLVPSRGLVVSPPMVEVAPGAQQLVRVIRTGAPPNGAGAVEEAYRLSVDELPIDAAKGAGLHFVVHYSVPIFVLPAGAMDVAPALQWSLGKDGTRAVLEVGNRGDGHAQLAALAFVDAAGRRTEIEPGLLGYVLPGSTMHWSLKPSVASFAAGGTLEVMVNGQKTTQALSPIRSR